MEWEYRESENRKEGVDSMQPYLDLTSGITEVYPLEPSPYVRPEYERTYRGHLSPAIRPGKARARRPRTRLLVYLLLVSLFTCGGVVAGGVLSLSYLQQAIPQMYPRYASGADATATPTPPATAAIPGTPLAPSVPTITPGDSGPLDLTIPKHPDVHPGIAVPTREHSGGDRESPDRGR